jgi:hypothetical protein
MEPNQTLNQRSEIKSQESNRNHNPLILWPTGQRMTGVDGNAYIQGIFERRSVGQPRWPTGRRMIYPPYAKRLCVCRGRNAIYLARREMASRERQRPELESKAGESGCQFLTPPVSDRERCWELAAIDFF